MATTIKSIVQFLNVGPGATVSLPHGIRDEADDPAVPDHVEGDTVGFMITADDTDVTVTNTNPGAASVNVLCELWHTLERPFGAASITELSPRPFVIAPGGAAAPTLLAVQDEGVLVGVRGTINLIGDGVSAVDNPGMNRVDITIAGTINVQDEGIAVGSRPTLNFLGDGVTAVDNPGMNRIDITVPGAGPATDLNAAYHNGRVVTQDLGNSMWNVTGLGETVFDVGMQLNNLDLATAIENQFTPSWVSWGSGWAAGTGLPAPIGFAIQGQPIGGVGNYSEGELHFLVNPDGGGFYSMGAVDSLGFFRAQQFGGYGFVGGGGQGLLIDAGLVVVTLNAATEIDLSIVGVPSAKVVAQGLAFLAGTVGAPGLFVDGDPNTGVYAPAPDNLAVAAGGVQSALFTAQGIGAGAGALGAPSIYFVGDTNTGLYLDGPDQLSVAAGGVRAAIFTTTGVGVPSGSALAAGLYIQGNSDTGLYEPAPNQLGITCGGISTAVFTPAAVTLTANTASITLNAPLGGIQITAGAGDVVFSSNGFVAQSSSGRFFTVGGALATPAYSAVGDTNTGIWFPAADSVEISCGATQSTLFTSQGTGWKAGAVGTPGLFVIGDTNTGLYASAADNLDITAGGVRVLNADNAGVSVLLLRMLGDPVNAQLIYTAGAPNTLNLLHQNGDLLLTGSGTVTITSTGAAIACSSSSSMTFTVGAVLSALIGSTGFRAGIDGTAAAPVFARQTDTDTGIYFAAADQLGISAGGGQVALFTTQGVGVPVGLVGTPGVFFIGDTNTGIWQSAADRVDIACNGIQAGRFTSGGIQEPAGAAATPSYTFDSDTDTGMYRVGADQIGFATSGNKRFEITSSGVGSVSGSATNPGIYFFNDSDTGIYRQGADAMGITTGGTERGRFDSNSTASETTLMLSVAGAAVQRVSVGANDSGGTGFRVLRVVN